MKNLKIGKRLVLSFLIATILASIAGIVGLFVSRDIDQKYSEALVTNGFAQGDIGQFNTYLNRASALVRDVIFLTDEQELKETQQELLSLTDKVNAALNAVKANCQTPEELEQIAIIEENLPKYQTSRNKVIELGVQNKNEEALDLFRSETNNYLNACMNATNALAEMNVAMGNEVSAQLTARSNTSIWIIIITIIVTFIVSVSLGVSIARSIAQPVREIEAAAREMAQGKLKADITYESKNELGSLSENMRVMIERIRFYMDIISVSIKQLAEGDLNVKRQEDFAGDFQPVQQSIRGLINSLNDALTQINHSSDQVASGSDQVSSGAQALSQGATEQASSVEELAATINEISAQVKETAENAAEAKMETNKAGDAIAVCNQQMKDMIDAMGEISEKSNEIGKIIKTIEDIAFQTNILALNAAVEAARAGAAGKGFAVVADEVRNLASKSAEASKSTSALIEGSIGAVEKGKRIANETAASLMMVVENAQAAVSTVDKIADAAETQASSIMQVTQGIDQISSVVQTNSATAEESAAASEELSGQAQVLKDLVGRFKLRREDDTPQMVREVARPDENYEKWTQAADRSNSKY